MQQPIIAIDGYSSTGKSSISKALAEELNFIHIDTGALYRGMTLYAVRQFLDDTNLLNMDEFLSNIQKIDLEFKNENGILVLYLNNEDVSEAIRSQEVANYVSEVAREPKVRDYLLDVQRKIGEKGGVILDGRDIGTVVFPNADYKFFLTASIDERTKRRYLELTNMGMDMEEDTVRENLLKRDKIDSEREVAPLKKADDAILIDNSDLSKEETVDLIASYIKN